MRLRLCPCHEVVHDRVILRALDVVIHQLFFLRPGHTTYMYQGCMHECHECTFSHVKLICQETHLGQ